MKPLLAHVYEPHRVTYPCYVQPKLNGIRALYQNGSFQSRDELPFPVGLLSHLSTPLLGVFDPSVILDGELYVHGWPLQRTNAAVTPVRQHPTEDTVKVEYHVFDKVDFTATQEERLLFLLGSFNQTKAFRLVNFAIAQDEARANFWYAEYVKRGYEGMMYRLGDCPYTVPKQKVPAGYAFCRSPFFSDKDNRCWHLLKRKDWQDDEFECVAVVEGEGKLRGTLGALTCRPRPIVSRGTIFEAIASANAADLRQFNVGSGLTDSERAHYWANPPIGKLIKVKYLCLSSDGIPLNPTILAIL